MIAKIIQGRGFKGAVNYVLDKNKAQLLASKGVRTSDKDSMIGSFITQSKLKPITKPVAHISLAFSAQDREKLTNEKMLEISQEYMKKMGYGNTQFIAVRHNDTDHPHLHLIINRVDFDGKRISDQNEKLRNLNVCKELTAKYGLYVSNGKENVKRHRLREPDATKYNIYDSLVKNVPLSKSWAELEKRLKADGIETEFKTKGSTDQTEGVKFSKNGYQFSGSKIDRMFSYSKIDFQLRKNDKVQQVRVSPQSQQPSLTNPVVSAVEGVGSLLGSLTDIQPSNSDYDPDQAEYNRLHPKKKKKPQIKCKTL